MNTNFIQKNICSFVFLFSLLFNFNSYAQITNIGNTFSPDTINVTVGTPVTFTLGITHNAVEVADSVWLNNGVTSNGGFNIPYGAVNDTFTPTVARTYYYVCQPHAQMGMKGVIIATPAVSCNGANSESFESATTSYSQGPWSNWTYDNGTSTFTANNGWRAYNFGTSSSSTGPVAAADSSWYLYCETSSPNNNGNQVANLISSCVDLSNFTDPAFLFNNHMYGATMGTLNVDVSSDGGLTWNNEWTKTGDQGNQWNEDVISLNTYTGNIQVRMSYTAGASFTGDCAIDNLRFQESPILGCTDTFAINFNPLATMDDGSCLYPGCTDPVALNYCSSCNADCDTTTIISGGNNTACCIYPTCTALPFYEDYESANLLTNQWVTLNGSQSTLGITTNQNYIIADTASLMFSGGTSWGTTPYNELDAFDKNTVKNDHIAQANVCLDFTSAPNPEMKFLLSMPSTSTAPYSWLRLIVNGTIIPDQNGNTAFCSSTWTGITGNVDATITSSTSGQTMTFDLSAYAGQSSVNITFQASNNYTTDYVVIDNINVYNVTPCTYYSASSVIFGTNLCNGDSTGAASISVNNGYGTDLYAWSNGSTLDTITGLLAGTYTCIVTDTTHGCVDTVTTIITEPSVISISAIVIDESAPIYNNGSINITPSGGTACVTDIQLGSDTLISTLYTNSYPLFNTYWHDSKVQMTFQAAELTALGMQIGQELTSVSWDVVTPSGQTMNNLNITISEGSSSSLVWSGNYDAVAGWNTFVFTTPVVWNGNDVIVEHCFDNTSYTTTTSYRYSVTSFNSVIEAHQDGATGGGCAMTPSLSVTNRPNTKFGTNADAYTYSWSSGDSTQDIDSLAAGPFSVTVTDCNGCVGSNAWVVSTNAVIGCRDPIANNFNPSANTDCGGNLFGNDFSCCTYDCNILNLTISIDSSSNVSCYGANDGFVEVSTGACNSWEWQDNGSTTSNRYNMAPGSYTLVALSCDSNCTDTLNVTITEPSQMVPTMLILNESAIGANDGLIDLSMSGGVPCATQVRVGNGNTSSYQSYLWYTFYMDNHTKITYPASELAALGMSQGDIIESLAFKILSQTGSAATWPMNGANLTVNGSLVWSGTYQAVVGMNNFTFNTPITYAGGDIVVEWCFDNTNYVSGNNLFESTIIGGTLSNYSDYSVGSGCNLITPTIARTYRPNLYLDFQASTGYSYLWSTGDTTEDISNLTSGQYCVTVTDCRGCVATACDSVTVSATYGCTDPQATNYNALANSNDGSCMYDCNLFTVSLDSSENVTCNSGNNGYAVASINLCGSVWWLDNNSTSVNRQNMSAGTYQLVGMTCDSMCYDTLTVVITEPSTISINSVIQDVSTAGANDGSIDLTVSGGSPCATSIKVGNDSISSSNNYLFYTFYHDGKSVITYEAAELASLGMNSGDLIDEIGWKIMSQTGSAAVTPMNNANLTINGTIVWSGTHQAILGLNNFALTTPFLYTGGDLVVEWCFDNTSFTSGNNLFECTSTNGLCSTDYADYSTGCTLTPSSTYNFRPNLYLGFAAVSGYSFIWSSGDSTEDVSNLSAGTYTVNVSDCYGCQDSASFVVNAGSTLTGCTDSTACNYDPTATVDDGSCSYIQNPAVQLGGLTWWYVNGSSEYSMTFDTINYTYTQTATWGWIGTGSFTLCNAVLFIDGAPWPNTTATYDSNTGGFNGTYGSNSPITIYPAVYGCTDSTVTNYNPLANIDDGSCNYCVYGCMDTTQFNYNPLATCDDGSCIPIIYGCTDSTALNYYSPANTNNGTCIYCTYGCIDSTATNYNPLATCNDNSCTYATPCGSPQPTGFSVTDITHDRAKVNWVDANTSTCMVDMYRVQYRVQGTNTWSQKTAMGSGLCQFGLTTTNKRLWNLTPSTTYEYRVKAWYCGASASAWSPIATFNTLDLCPDVVNFTVTSPLTTRATFTWSAPSTPYSFVRIKLRVDTVGSTWLTAGGFGVMYPTLTRNKNGLVAGESYRASSRTWCDPNGGAYKALTWSPFIFWTQPGGSIRLADSENAAITDLSVYPNPSRDIFNVTFVSDEVQNLDISITNVVGEAVYSADLEQFVGQFTKEVSLATYPKGIYFLHVTTDKGVVIKKLTLQ